MLLKETFSGLATKFCCMPFSKTTVQFPINRSSLFSMKHLDNSLKIFFSYQSSELIQPIISPEALAKPLLIACDCPASDSEIQNDNFDSYFFIISTELSVLPPSIIIYSKFGYP